MTAIWGNSEDRGVDSFFYPTTASLGARLRGQDEK